MTKHIVIVCTRLDLPGGIERATVNLANLFQAKGHKVTIAITDETPNLFYNVNTEIKIEWLNIHFGITAKGNVITRKRDFVRHILHLRRVYKKLNADFIIGTEYSITIASWFAGYNLRAKILGWEHHHIFWLKKNKFWTFLFNKVYPKLDFVVCQNKTEKNLFEKMGCRSFVIPYSLQRNMSARATLQSHEILTIGWLIKRKGVDLIPSIAEKVIKEHKDWRWKIIGKGEEYKQLKSELSRRNLEAFVSIVDPASSDIADEYLNASIYVMTSRFECLPMVLLEATSFGLPCIAFDCPTGPTDIIQNDKNGVLVALEDIDAMAKAIDDLITDESKRSIMGEAAYQSSARYMPQKIYDGWDELLGLSRE